MSPYPYTITNDTVSVVVEGETLTVRRGADNFEAARKAVLSEDWSDIKSILSPGLRIEKWLKGRFAFVGGYITYMGERIDERLNKRLIAMAESGASPEAWLKFWGKLQDNPSMRSVSQLPSFLENKGIPIDDTGCILAYKAVRSNYLDFHSGTVLNSVGSKHSMPRNKISDDPNHACHEGFHVGALEYARSFGDPNRRILICRVDPADVVCIPYDSSSQKMRTCKYEVLSEPETVAHMSDTYEPSKVGTVQPNEGSVQDDDLDDDLDADLDDDLDDDLDADLDDGLDDDQDDGQDDDAAAANDLQAKTLQELRVYARSIGVKGANNSPGGKVALIAAIQAALRT
jgi:hypothetical protein